MESVFLEDFAYPCVAYVIRRLGLEQEIKQLFVATGEEYSSTTNLIPGDIIIWEYSSGITEGNVTLTMGTRGPITTKFFLGRHFGVYEGDGLVSDLTFNKDDYQPHIRLMSLLEHPRPERFLRLTTLINTEEINHA